MSSNSVQMFSTGLYSNNPSSILTSLISTDLEIIILGITFSILSILSALYTSVGMGYLLTTGSTAPIFNSTLHIILTLLTLAFAFTGSLLVTKMEVRTISCITNKNFKEISKKIKVPLKDLILTLVIILLLIIFLAVTVSIF